MFAICLLFTIITDWLMKRTTKGRDMGIKWVGEEVLDDIDYADDLAIPSGEVEDA